ncbi:MAG: hypothetical protein JW807_14880 [Spirochaetes bacterium]|nr:hypothetical protein [Spirochaetota bacterium]
MPHRVSAYISTLYYLEIIFLMLMLVFLYGKAVAVSAGIILSLALAYHIIQLYYKKKPHRIIQLWIIDVHAAFTAGYLFYNAWPGVEADALTRVIIAARIVILLCELPLLFILTAEKAAGDFR